MLQDVNRLAEAQICQAAHEHWLAYASHSNLEPASWAKVKEHATKALRTLRAALTPWVPESEPETQKDTIKGEYADLIRQYKNMLADQQTEKDKTADENKGAE